MADERLSLLARLWRYRWWWMIPLLALLLLVGALWLGGGDRLGFRYTVL
jgi:hypothetical protein